MLYLHCGWPKTGTKSLQAALHAERGALAAVGVAYPDRWRRRLLPEADDGSHNGFTEALEGFEGSPAALDPLLDLLTEHAGGDVLISSELIALWALPRERDAVADRVLAMVRERMPVTCVWALRRFDDFFCSLYLQLVSTGLRLPVPERVIERAQPRRLFAAMRQMEASADAATHVEYRTDGGHQAELLRAFGLPAAMRATLEAIVAGGPRRNPAFTHKQAVALINAESLSARCGIGLDRPLLRRLFTAGFEFDDDRPCELLSGTSRRRLREDALECASAAGVDSYVRFFSHEDGGPDDGVPSLAPSLLGDEDLRRLAEACLKAPAGRPAPE